MEKIVNILRNERIVGAIGALLLLVICLPYVILGEDAYIIIHDNLDGIIANLKLLKDNHALFDPDAILPMMGGIRRSSFGNEWNLTLLPFAVLPCYWANVVNIFIVKITAYVGMFLLLHNYLTKELHPVIVMLVSLAFACIPFYATCCGISSAGIPLLGYAFLNLRDNKHLALSYAMIVYYAFGSFLVFSGVFVCFYLLCYGAYLFYAKRAGFKNYVIGFALLCLVYAATNYNMFISYFVDSGYVSHRTEFDLTCLQSRKSMLMDALRDVLFSQYHAGAFAAWIVMIVFAISFTLKRSRIMWLCLGIWSSIVFFVVSVQYISILDLNISILKQFQFERFIFLYPGLCFVMLGVALSNLYTYMNRNIKVWRAMALGICVILMAYNLFIDTEMRSNWRYMCMEYQRKSPSYKEFYAEDVFEKITEDLQIKDRISTKVVSIAMYPAVAEYNGFYCLDGYFSSYPLRYKHRFRNVIENELEKSEDLRNYFDAWGNRCYVFVADIQEHYVFRKDSEVRISQLDINVDALSELGCEYVFSGICLPSIEGLSYVDEYDTATSFYRIFVYKLTKNASI